MKTGESGKLNPSHPRYDSLRRRRLLTDGFLSGIVVPEGLIAHGRGEMFDYLLGEKSTPAAIRAEKAATAALLLSEKAVISVNGNVAALCPKDIAKLSTATGSTVEVNLFHWSKERAKKIRRLLESNGAKDVLAEDPDARLAGIASDRAQCHIDGIYSADTVLLPLEDGDRAIALSEMGKRVISIDLNPLSRTSLVASISIVDELTRALPHMSSFAKGLKGKEKSVARILNAFDNDANLKEVVKAMNRRLNELASR